MRPFDWTILIPTIPKRKELFDALESELYRQILEVRKIYPDVIVTIDSDDSEFERIGTKRNNLLYRAISRYVSYFDDDDWPFENYILRNVEGIIKGVDACSLRGVITWDGINPEVYEHALKFKEYKTNDGVLYPEIKYERYPNHLNCIKSSIAKQFKFPEINHGEDTDWATQVFNSGLIQAEYYIDEPIYHYRFKPNK